MTAEADIARDGDAGVIVIAGGGNARRIVDGLETAEPDAVLSFGLAGGLSPELRPGDARIATGIEDRSGRRYPVDVAWTSALTEALGVPNRLFLGVDAPLADATAKADAHQFRATALVDMESHIVASWAVRRDVPFAALRVVSDPAARTLPHAATVGMRADGTVDLPAVLASLARSPRQLPALIRTGLDARAAFATLLRCRQRLGPAFARLDL